MLAPQLTFPHCQGSIKRPHSGGSICQTGLLAWELWPVTGEEVGEGQTLGTRPERCSAPKTMIQQDVSSKLSKERDSTGSFHSLGNVPMSQSRRSGCSYEMLFSLARESTSSPLVPENGSQN